MAQRYHVEKSDITDFYRAYPLRWTGRPDRDVMGLGLTPERALNDLIEKLGFQGTKEEIESHYRRRSERT